MERSWRKRENNDQSDESKSLYNELLVTSIKLKKKKKEKNVYNLFNNLFKWIYWKENVRTRKTNFKFRISLKFFSN